MSASAEPPQSVWQWIAAAIVVAVLPHLLRLPLWITLLIFVALGLRLALRRPPSRWLLAPVVITVFAAVLLQYRTLSGANAGGAFFAAMVALKFLESRDRRDAGLLVCLSYFLATSIFLTTESIGVAVYVLSSIAVTTTAMITLAAPSGPPPILRVRRVGALLLQALPIMLILFLLFPRLSGPLWGLGRDPAAAMSGLDDTMEPGSISNLLISSDVAFRAQFAGTNPPRSQRYWRGPVLWQFDGRTWSVGNARVKEAPVLERTGGLVKYTVILEPHGRHWVLGLDLPLSLPEGAGLTPGHNLLSRQRIKSVRRFSLESASDYHLEPSVPPARRQRALQLPPEAAPRARALAQRWAGASDGPEAIIERALAMFREQKFFYTLTPPRLSGDPVDQFLFETRRGFCEHYAGAFVFLMRAAGVPARVVTGYQGGEVNALGEYLIVRQSDAHAWTEVWLSGRGWVRVDPTGAVSPDRIELGIANVAGAADRLGGLSRRGSGIWRELALAWDSINHNWNQLVVGYGPELQRRLLRNLGLDDLGRYALALLTVITAGLAATAIWLLATRMQRDADPVARQWRRAIRRLQAVGIDPRATEGPSTLARRVAMHRPDLAPAFGRITRLYNGLRYGRRARAQDLERLQREVSQFQPRRRPKPQQDSGGTANRTDDRTSKR